LSKIVSIGTAVPAFCHKQADILQFMQMVYAPTEADRRKMRYLYNQSGIQQRFSVVSDYGRPLSEWKFYPQSEGLEPFPTLEQRMAIYHKQAPLLSVDAIRDCLHNVLHDHEITHFITVSCTGMSAPGLDLQVMDMMDFGKNIFRTSINFMGCYAAIHALRLADALCKAERNAKVLIVCTELCTLHFQREATLDNIISSILFGDGSAAALVVSDDVPLEGLTIDSFHSEVIVKGKRDMAWEISSTGFLMTLTSYVPDLIEEDFSEVMDKVLDGVSRNDVCHWCLPPCGKRILEAMQKSTVSNPSALQHAYDVLKQHGNLSSATVLFVLKRILADKNAIRQMVGVALGPGLTVETFTAHY